MTEERIFEAINCLKATFHKNGDCHKLIKYLSANVPDIIETLGGDEPIEAPLPKYTLWLTINADDDAEIKYNGHSYCYYSDDLRIMKSFESLEAIHDYLDNEVEVVEGYKATNFIRQFINNSCNEVIEEHDFKNGAYNNVYSGNQEMDCYITLNK